MEVWDVYDVNRNKTDKIAVRGNPLGEGEYHLVVHVCIFNSKDEMLIQQRQSFKSGWPNMWDITAGGSAVSGDDTKSAAEREVLEELGIKVDLQRIRPKLTINFADGFDDIYLVDQDVDLNDLKLQYEEVQNARWASKDEILRMIENKEFIPYFPSYIALLFECREQYGTARIM